MDARARYYFLKHETRLLMWQIEQAERAERELKDRRREVLRRLRWANRRHKLGIGKVIRDNIALYNRVCFHS